MCLAGVADNSAVSLQPCSQVSEAQLVEVRWGVQTAEAYYKIVANWRFRHSEHRPISAEGQKLYNADTELF